MAALLLAAPRLTALLQPSSSCRRDVVASLVGCSSILLPAAAVGYDSVESAMASQFAAAEAARSQREQRAFETRRSFELKVRALQGARTADEFVAASDSLALELIRLQAIPEGTSLQSVVGGIRATYNLLPKVRIECEGRRECFNHGSAVENAYTALLRELRRYASKSAYAQSGGYELPNTPFSF